MGPRFRKLIPVFIGAVFLFVAVAGCLEEKEERPSQPSRASLREEALKKAKSQLEGKQYAAASRLALEGYKRWQKRAGGRTGRMYKYLDLLYQCMDRSGAELLLKLCVRNKSAREDRLCGQILLGYLQRGAVEPQAFSTAVGLYDNLCTQKEPRYVRYHDLCAKIPEDFILKPKMRNRILETIKKNCIGSEKDLTTRTLCGRYLVSLWDHAIQNKDKKELQVLSTKLLSQGETLGAKRVLQALANLPDSASRKVLERVFLQGAGEPKTLDRLVGVFLEDLNRSAKRRLLKRYGPLLRKKIPEAFSLLAQLDISTARRLLHAFGELKIKGLKKLFAELRQRLEAQPSLVLKRYLTVDHDDKAQREKILALLRHTPTLLYGKVISKMAVAPLPIRDRYRSLVAELDPAALHGKVAGRILRGSSFKHVSLDSCFIQLVEVKSCDVKDSIGPDKDGRPLGTGRGDGVRVRSHRGGEGRRDLCVQKDPCGPYDPFLYCPGTYRMVALPLWRLCLEDQAQA